MPEFGVTETGFRVKPFQDILNAKATRAREMFGDDVDLRPTSPLRKLLDVTSYADQELWKEMERLFYANYVSTASGTALDLLGDDLGLPRRPLPARGTITATLDGEEPGRLYHLPIGTLLQAGPDGPLFRLTERVTLSETTKEATGPVEAVERGPVGLVAPGAITRIQPAYADAYLNLGRATIEITNEAALDGGDAFEGDTAYRAMLLSRPRTVWTRESVRHAVKAVDGVRDCRLFDPLGGTDVSLSKFGLFRFRTRTFGIERRPGAPYFFEILIAVQPGFLFETLDGVPGVHDRVTQAIEDVRPVSIFPTLLRANNVRVGLRARVTVRSGHDRASIGSAIRDRLDQRINALGLGATVRYAQVLCDVADVSGVSDVQDLRLRRCPALMGTITFGDHPTFQTQDLELGLGENLDLRPDEIAVFKVDDTLLDVQFTD